MRSTRNQPFCWQEKKINRLIRKMFTGSNKMKMLLLYTTITEIDSDFNGKDIKYYTKTISTYSGLSKEFIPQGLKKLEQLNILTIIEEKENGKFKGKRIEFTSQKIKTTLKTVHGKPVHGKPVHGKDASSEDSSLIEDNKEERTKKKEEKVAIAPTPTQTMKEFLKSIDNQTFVSFLEDKIDIKITHKGAEEMEKFASYWSELNGSGKKQKWELQKTFELKRRIKTWFNNIDNWNNN